VVDSDAERRSTDAEPHSLPMEQAASRCLTNSPDIPYGTLAHKVHHVRNGAASETCESLVVKVQATFIVI